MKNNIPRRLLEEELRELGLSDVYNSQVDDFESVFVVVGIAVILGICCTLWATNSPAFWPVIALLSLGLGYVVGRFQDAIKLHFQSEYRRSVLRKLERKENINDAIKYLKQLPNCFEFKLHAP